ncbi:hypothetical protein HMPREF0216_03013 [Clostridium celatum DSM 1785]|uniref:Multidrug resistance efflux transporter family protein n=2 Tax=Clostridium celatum TaxID=36834 RepID=L1Q5H6_9CLOT|nr:hypothetical protein HMPREF0216_03013 [Clostridium celatum DSM 1785]
MLHIAYFTLYNKTIFITLIFKGVFMKKSLFLGILAAFFFSFTFILNSQMNTSGGSWIWSASLRYIFMLPILFIIVFSRKEIKPVLKSIKKNLLHWFVWSTVGFGLFYAPLSFASMYGASWMVASTWQITIIAGALLSPLFFTITKKSDYIVHKRNLIPKKAVSFSLIILVGVFLIQSENANNITLTQLFLGIIPVIIAAFAYPLGNRKMMEICDNNLNTFQRVFGMTLCSLPFWILLSIFGIGTVGLPSYGQVFQSFLVALFSGVIATILFFKATELVKNNSHQLAVVEATQSGEVIFTLIGEIFILKNSLPGIIGYVGIILVIIGMILNSLFSSE